MTCVDCVHSKVCKNYRIGNACSEGRDRWEDWNNGRNEAFGETMDFIVNHMVNNSKSKKYNQAVDEMYSFLHQYVSP